MENTKLGADRAPGELRAAIDDGFVKNFYDALVHPLNVFLYGLGCSQSILTSTSIGDDGLMSNVIHRHIEEMLMVIVYSRGGVCLIDSVNGGSIFTLSGFLEREGRMPTGNDGIVLFTDRFYFNTRVVASFGMPVIEVYSDINFMTKDNFYKQ